MSRLVLRSLKPEDESVVLEMLQDAESMRFLGPRRALEPAEAEDWFRDEYDNPSRFVVALGESDELVGFCGVKELNGILDFGYFIRRKYWGEGYATEACRLAVDSLKDKVDLSKAEVFIAEENTASVRVADKLGWERIAGMKKGSEAGHLYRISSD